MPRDAADGLSHVAVFRNWGSFKKGLRAEVALGRFGFDMIIGAIWLIL